LLQKPSVTHGVDCGHQDLGELLGSRWCVRIDHFLPANHALRLDVEEGVVQRVVREDESAQVPHELTERLPVLFNKATSERPHEAEDEELLELIEFFRRILVWLGQLRVNEAAKLLH